MENTGKVEIAEIVHRPRRRLVRPSVLWRTKRVAFELDISRRAFERLRSAGGFPPPDKVIGKMPLWKPGTIRAWVGVEEQSV